MYEEIRCVNDPATAGIKAIVTWDGYILDGLTKYQLRRYFTGGNTYKVLTTGNINSSVDLTYTYDDIDTVAGVSYTYDACVLNENNVRVGGARFTIVHEFDGILIGDETGSWHSAFGTSESSFSLSAKKNRPVGYVTTLNGKFPHRISNSEANYWTGSCTAVWFPKGTHCGEPVIEGADRLRLSFLEWLTNDNVKFLKTSDGKAMLVSIDDDIQEEWSPYKGLTAVSFGWTQVGEVPTASLVSPPGKAWVSE